ncbi:MAG: trimethylamine methyltransferase family protein, partial [Litoreibacter sp.]|nr:trimethylamine methyltransferase family protein [Litoreibacter sp.]
RALRGIEVNEENLGFDAICEAVLGEGHFLGTALTHAAMERDYHYPKLADRQQPIAWEKEGGPEAWQRAKDEALRILETHHPDYIMPEQDRAIRSAFPILN